jgi:hypothetical protein
MALNELVLDTITALDAHFEPVPGMSGHPGDVDGDGDTDLEDFGALKDHFGAGTTQSKGDFDADEDVDLEDFNILKENFGTSASHSSAVPEPSGFMITLVGTLFFLAVHFIRVSRSTFRDVVRSRCSASWTARRRGPATPGRATL